MDSFELNKIMGAVLGTCLVLLVTNFAANAIFAPAKIEKPGFEIAVKEDASGGAESNTIEVTIYGLRKKLGADFILTARGLGYMVGK